MEFLRKVYRWLQKVYHALQRLCIRSAPPEGRPLNIARSPSGSDFTKPMMIARMPVTPLSEMNIARAPKAPVGVEVITRPVQVFPAQSPVPGRTIDVQPSQERITRDRGFF
jgi:hypothetical protein